MNRAFTVVAAQSAIAAAILVAAPLAAANPFFHDGFDPTAAPIASIADRAEVRRDAVAAARDSHPAFADEGRSVPAAFVSTVSRDEVRAQAVAAARDVLALDHEGRSSVSPLAEVGRPLIALGR